MAVQADRGRRTLNLSITNRVLCRLSHVSGGLVGAGRSHFPALRAGTAFAAPSGLSTSRPFRPEASGFPWFPAGLPGGKHVHRSLRARRSYTPETLDTGLSGRKGHNNDTDHGSGG